LANIADVMTPDRSVWLVDDWWFEPRQADVGSLRSARAKLLPRPSDLDYLGEDESTTARGRSAANMLA
jgi:hypothetical protein